MGVIRSIFLVFVSVFLFLSLFAVSLSWILSSSLKYENVQTESVVIIKDFLKGSEITSQIESFYPLIQQYCKNNSNFAFNAGGYTLDIPCSIASQGEDAILKEGIKDVISGIYYTKYECSFLNCFQNDELPLFLVSEKAHIFWRNVLYIAIALSLLLLALAFLLSQKKTNALILAGSLMILSSLPFIKLDTLFDLFSDDIFKFLKIFFSKAYFISLRMIIAGAVLIVAGIILKIFRIGFSISDFISRLKETAKPKKTKKPSRSKSK
jgi:hypothetical protein